MKKILYIERILPLAVMLICMAGCIKDDTNFNFASDNQGLTGGVLAASTVEFDLGADIELESAVVIHDPTLKESDLGYEWYMAGKLVSTDRNMSIPNTFAPGSYPLGLVVIDTRSGTRYTLQTGTLEDGRAFRSQISVKISSPYVDGFAVLTNLNGKSKLGHIRYTAADEWRDFSADIYTLYNEGEELGGEPVSLCHHIYFVSPYEYALHINQNGGVGPVDIKMSSMQRIGRIDQQFMGGYPAGMQVRDVRYFKDNVLLLTQNGKVYVRPEQGRTGTIAPHAGRFPGIPMLIDGGVDITQWVNKLEGSGFYATKVIAFDDLNKRLLAISSKTSIVEVMNQYREEEAELIKPGDPGTDGVNAYPGLKFPAPDNLTGYKLAILGTYGGACHNNAPLFGSNGDDFTVAAVLKKESDNTFYMYQFDWTDYPGSDVNLKKFCPFPVAVDDNVRYAVYPHADPYMFFTAAGNTQLYFMNLRTNEYRLVYTETTPITAIQSGTISVAAYETGGTLYESTIGLYWQKLAIGTQSGKVTILDVAPQKVEGTGMLEVIKNYDISKWGPVVDIAFIPGGATRVYSAGRR